MITWVALGFYALGWLLTMRVIAGRMAWQYGEPDGEDIAMSCVCGALIALAWPIIVPGYALHQRGLLISAGHSFIVMPKDRRLEQAEQRARDAEYRIKQLDREVLR